MRLASVVHVESISINAHPPLGRRAVSIEQELQEARKKLTHVEPSEKAMAQEIT